MNPAPANRTEIAARIWLALQEFVSGEDRRRALRAALDLGLGKAEVLIKLMDGPMTLRDIANAVDVDPPAATVGVDQLERRGLVCRTPHPDDRRRKLVHLTDAGRDAAQNAQAILEQPPAALLELGLDELGQLEQTIASLRSPSRSTNLT